MQSDPESGKLSKRKAADRRYELERPSRNSPLSRIGVSLSEYQAAPKISPILREIQGGKSKALRAMRFSSQPLIRTFLEKYDSIPPRDRGKLSIEAIALAAKIEIPHLWGEIMLAMREHSVSAVKVIAVAAHPDIMKARVEFAQLPGGYRDRDKLDEILGAVKPANGNTFIGRAFFGGQQPESDTDKDEPEASDDLEYMFPDASAIQERHSPIKQKALPGGK